MLVQLAVDALMTSCYLNAHNFALIILQGSCIQSTKLIRNTQMQDGKISVSAGNNTFLASCSVGMLCAGLGLGLVAAKQDLLLTKCFRWGIS